MLNPENHRLTKRMIQGKDYQSKAVMGDVEPGKLRLTSFKCLSSLRSINLLSVYIHDSTLGIVILMGYFIQIQRTIFLL